MILRAFDKLQGGVGWVFRLAVFEQSARRPSQRGNDRSAACFFPPRDPAGEKLSEQTGEEGAPRLLLPAAHRLFSEPLVSLNLDSGQDSC